MHLNNLLIRNSLKSLVGSIVLCIICYFTTTFLLTPGLKSDLYIICVLPFIAHPFLALLYIFATLAFSSVNFKNKQDKKGYTIICVSFLFLLAGLLSIQEIAYHTFSLGVSFVCLCISLIALISISFLITFFEKLNIYTLYFALIVPLGLIYYLAILPWSTPDAVRHMAAVYRFSNIALMQDEWSARKIDSDFFENVWVNHKNVTLSGYKAVSDNIKAPVDLQKTDTLSIKDTDMTCYSFVSYLPLVAGVVFGRLLDLNTLQTAYLAKLCMFICYVLGIFLALKTIPEFKYTIAMIALCPMALMYASGISYDGMVIITTFNFIASVFAFCKKKTRFKFGMVLVWTFLTASCKGGGYIILLPLVFMFKNYKLVLCVLLTALSSLLIFNDFLYTDQPMFQLNKNIADNLYTSWAFFHPLEYIGLLFNTYTNSFGKLFFQLFGAKLGWLQNTINEGYIIALFVTVLLAALKDAVGQKSEYRSIVLQMSVFVIAVVGIPLLLLCETAHNADAVFGMQGRYFLPILPVLMFLIGNTANILPYRAQNILAKINPKVVFICFAGISYLCIYCMMQYFWRAA